MVYLLKMGGFSMAMLVITRWLFCIPTHAISVGKMMKNHKSTPPKKDDTNQRAWQIVLRFDLIIQVSEIL
jgi:hypothetical protein